MLYRFIVPLMSLSISLASFACYAQGPSEGAGGSSTAEQAAVSHDGDKPSAGSGHEGEQVDNDATHGNLSDQTYEVTDFRTDMAFFSAIVFLLLLAGLSVTAWKPIMEGLEKREKGIADNIEKAHNASVNAQAKLAEYEAKLAAAHGEAQGILAAARKDAESVGQKLVAVAQEEAVRQRERASVDIESAKRVALGELAAQSTDVAMVLASRVVGREVRADDHQGLIQEMLSKLPSNN